MEVIMIRHPHTRRAFALVLTVLGGVMLFLAPDDVWIGAILLSLGMALEIIGAWLQRRNAR
jgi:hypothetical protein